jgi:hypothetical protein
MNNKESNVREGMTPLMYKSPIPCKMNCAKNKGRGTSSKCNVVTYFEIDSDPTYEILRLWG